MISPATGTLPIEGCRVPWLRSVLAASAVVAASRAVLLVVMLATMGLQSKDPAGSHVEVDWELLSGTLQRVAFANDAGWYSTIVRNGYEARPFDTSRQANWAFFPLWPMLWSGAAALTGEMMWSGLLLANLLLVVAMVLLHRLATQLADRDVRQGDAAVLFACFAPASYFFSFPQTESLFLVLVLLAFLQATRSRHAWASGAGALASAARFNGLFLLPALWITPGLDWRDRRRLWLLLVPVGSAAFAAWLWHLTGNPFAFSDIQVAWGRAPTFPTQPITDYLSQPYRIIVPWNPLVLNMASAIMAMLAVAWCVLRRRWGMALLVVLTLLAPLATGTLMSLTRYMLAAFPIYLMLADVATKRPLVGGLLLAMSASAMGALVVGFQLSVTVAGA